MATLLPCGEVPRPIAPADGRTFTLAELQAVVGGYIEAVYLPDRRIMYVNEDGKREQLPYNDAATSIALAARAIHSNDVIVGAAIICTRAETGDD
jgi:hypothetical protein